MVREESERSSKPDSALFAGTRSIQKFPTISGHQSNIILSRKGILEVLPLFSPSLPCFDLYSQGQSEQKGGYCATMVDATTSRFSWTTPQQYFFAPFQGKSSPYDSSARHTALYASPKTCKLRNSGTMSFNDL